MSIHANALPLRRAAITTRPTQAVGRSAGGGAGLLFSNQPDPANAPRVFIAAWTQIGAAIADAVWLHYRDHSTGPFQITLPVTGEVVDVIYSAPPSIAWASPATAASVTVELEETLAHE